MRLPFVCLMVLTLLTAAGCGKAVRMGGLSRVQAAVLTDAVGLNPTAGGARPPVRVTDPDRLAALEQWLKQNPARWHKASGPPRPTRFQLELIGDGQPLVTLWLEHGYAMMSVEGTKPREARLSNAEAAELMACLGLPPDYLATAVSTAPDLGPPRHGVVKGPKTKT